MIGLELLKRFGPPLLALLAIVAVLWVFGDARYSDGLADANTAWQSKWDKEQSRLSDAKADAEAEQRRIEQARQKAANEAAENGQKQIDAANADAAAAHAAADSVRGAANAIIDRLTVSQSSLSACTVESSKAAARAARVLADVFARADQRAGVLASVADQARARGVTCEAAYDGLDSK